MLIENIVTTLEDDLFPCIFHLIPLERVFRVLHGLKRILCVDNIYLLQMRLILHIFSTLLGQCFKFKNCCLLVIMDFSDLFVILVFVGACYCQSPD